MHKKFHWACLIIVCCLYGTPATSVLLPEQDLEGNPTPPAIRVQEKNVEDARAQVIIGSMHMSKITSAFSESDESRAQLGPQYKQMEKRLHAAIDQMCKFASGWSLVINFCVQDPETPFESDSSNPLWRLLVVALLNPEGYSEGTLEEVYTLPIMEWVMKHGGWKTQTDIEIAALEIEIE